MPLQLNAHSSDLEVYSEDNSKYSRYIVLCKRKQQQMQNLGLAYFDFFYSKSINLTICR
jgi:hypothetical protein